MYQSPALTKIALRKTDLRAESHRIRLELNVHANDLQSFAQFAELGFDLIKTLRRPDIAAPALFGIFNATAFLKIHPPGLLKSILTAGRLLLRGLPR